MPFRSPATRPWLASLLIGAVILACVLWLRWPAFGFKVWNVDEAIHAAAARTLLDGGVIYRDAIDQRTPLSYYAVAAVFAVFGENNLWAVHAAIAVLIAATAWCLFLLGRHLRGFAAGAWSAALYAILSTALLYQGDANAANTEWFVAFFTAAAACLFLTAPALPSARRIYGTGLLLGAAFLSKQPALLDFAAPVAALLWLAGQRTFSPRRLAALSAVLAAGWLTPVLITLAWLATHGALRDGIYYAWTYNLSIYGPEIAGTDRILSHLFPFRLLGASHISLLLLWLAGSAVIAHRLLQRQPTAEERTSAPAAVYLAVWTLASLVGAASGGRAFDHYYIQFLPAFALGAGLATAHAARLIRTTGRPAILRLFAALLLVALVVQLGVATLAARRRTVPVDPSLRVAAYIRAHSAPDARIFVWGFHPDLYLYADRKPASRFLYCSFLTGLIPWTNIAPARDTAYAIVPGAMDQLLHDLTARQPEFIVDCSAGPNRHWQKYPLEKFPALHAFIHDRYKVVEAGQFVPQGFQLFQRRGPDEIRETSLQPELSASLRQTLTLGVLGQSLPPFSASSPHATAFEIRDGRAELFVHAPSRLTYRVPAGAGAMRGGFGIRAEAYAAGNSTPTDGAEFIIRWRDTHGTEEVLLRRLLRPRETATDRPIQFFRVTFPAGGPGELILQITPGPADNAACDWTFWSDLMLENFRLDARPANLE